MADENIIDDVVDTKVVTDTAKSDVVETTTTAATDPAKPDDKSITTPADWPADWREKAAGGDAKKLQRLTRYTSPQAIADALIAAQNKISAGDLKVALGKDAKPEEIAAYREAHGIPEAPDKYDLTGLDFAAAEKAMVDKFLVSAHSANMTPTQVRASLDAFSKLSEDARNTRLSDDNDLKTKAEDKLRSEWGNEYRTNINLITNLLDGAPAGFRDKFLHGRLSDGTPIGSDPEALQFLVNVARERNPAGVVVPSGVATESAVMDELSKIEKLMRTDRAAYNKDEAMQARYRELLVYRENHRLRAA